MRYNVSQLLKEPIGSTRHDDVDQVIPSPEPEWGAELTVQGPVDMLRTTRGILVTAALMTWVPGNCARCLESLTEPLAVNMEDEFFPSVDVWSGAPVRTPDENEGFLVDRRHSLDLNEAFRQGVWTAVELQTLCTPDCRGLCPTCGTNLNQDACSCEVSPIDPRWERLRRRSS